MGIRITRHMGVVLFLYSLSFFKLRCLTALDTLTPTQYIRDGETIVSAGEEFELGFFSPPNSSNRYVGIWYKNIPERTIVWVANREIWLRDTFGQFSIDEKGDLVVLDGRRNTVWSTNISVLASNSSARLLDSGNLVLREGRFNKMGRVLWQSFDHPSDTLLPTMELGINLKTGERTNLTSWKGSSDPSLGSFTAYIDTQNLPQSVILNGSIRYWRSGPWDGHIFIGITDMDFIYTNGFNLVTDNQNGRTYVTYSYVNNSTISRLILDSLGKMQQYHWDKEKMEWKLVWSTLSNECDVYGKCGPFGSCNRLNSPACSCLRGFEPRYSEDWSKGHWSGGCVRRTQLKCNGYSNSSNSSELGKQDGFWKLELMKFPDYPNWFDVEDGMECESECMKNCSCLAYAYNSAIGCMRWSQELIDIQEFSGGMELYIRRQASELNADKSRHITVIIILTVVLGIFIVAVFVYLLWRRIANRRGKKIKNQEIRQFDLSTRMERNMGMNNVNQGNGPQLPLFNFEELAIATNNFCDANKLGQGGFGPVYKGKLKERQEIAVKRLSKSSDQGLEEFKNEVLLISKLQHRNLVRLLGCCIEREEKMLLYEYMPNKSLDAFLFDTTKSAILDWPKRFHIVEGIARGLLYLHRDSRFKIIHRDLKASNILLDAELNPKISDFGMARILGGNQIQADTKRLVGTYGYMAPEYAMEGRFSDKSDVFSFGVLLLEIVSGRKNTSIYDNEHSLNLLEYAWKAWKDDKVFDLVDSSIGGSFSKVQVLRCIHVGFLCVQEFAIDRPTISSIVSMLCGEITTLPTPKQPAFTERISLLEVNSLSDINEVCTANNVTITAVEGR